VAQSFRTAFDKNVSDFRDKDILHLIRSDVREFELTTPRETIIAKKEEQSPESWVLSRTGAPAELTEIHNVLNTLTDLRAISFASEKSTNLSAYGLAAPTVKVLIKKQDQARIGVSVGK